MERRSCRADGSRHPVRGSRRRARDAAAQLDEVLNEDLREIELFLQDSNYDWASLTEELDRKALGHDFHRWFVQFFDEHGEPAWASLHTPVLPPLKFDQRTQRTFTVESPQGESPQAESPPAAHPDGRSRTAAQTAHGELCDG